MDRRSFLATAAACSAVSASTAQFARAQARGAFAAAAGYSAQRDGATFLVARHGIILREDYNDGGAATRWPIGAGTRAFMPLLAATLIEDRLLNLDEPVANTLLDWATHPLKSLISIRVLISGVSGLRYGPNDPQDLPTALTLEPREEPGVRFSADAASYVLFAEIARRKLEAAGRDPDAARYLTAQTLLPIGCVPIGWARGEDGLPRFDDGAAVSARGWAQAGELIRREGVWRAEQLADAFALREAMRGSIANARAGFGLWIAGSTRTRDDAGIDTDLWRNSSLPDDLAMAAGANGERLYLCQSLGFVAVRQPRTLGAAWSDQQFLSLLLRDL